MTDKKTPTLPPTEMAPEQEKEEGFWRKRMNGKPLDTLEWSTSVLNVPPSAHRLNCALGLAAGLYLGSELMKVLTGLDLKGNKVEFKNLPRELQPFHNKLSYNYHSDNPADRWMRVVHNMVPGVIGAIGTYIGSKNYFRKRSSENKDPEYLDEFECRAEELQSRPWGKLAGFSSMWSSVSGFGWLPFPNYGATLGSRFTLASGRKVALPIVGKYWSNNHSIYPYSAPRLIDHMIQYAVHNPSENPEQLEQMAQGILAHWFKDVSPEQVDAMVQEVHDARSKFVEEGGVPKDLKKQLEKELKAVFKGAGLEETLERIGLDPLNAEIGANGFSAKAAAVMGARKDLENLSDSYAERYQARKAQREMEGSPSGPSVV